MIAEVDISPSTHLINSIMNSDMAPEIACAELIDNSFDAQANYISFHFDSSNRSLTVIDDGLGLSDIKAIVKLGCHDNEGRNTSGRYGVGGMDAILSFGSLVEITSIRNNIQKQILVDFDEIKKSHRWTASIPEPILIPDSKSGTIIKIKNIKKSYHKYTSLMDKLQVLFSPALRSGKQIFINNTKLNALPLVKVDQELKGEGEFNGKQFKWYAGVKPKTITDNGGWTVILKHRIIKESAAYGLQNFSAYRFYGLIELIENDGDLKWEVTKHKNNLRELEDLCEHIFEINPEIKTLLEKVNSEDSVELESQIAMEVSENLTEAFTEITNSLEKRNANDVDEEKLPNDSTEIIVPRRKRIKVTRHQSGNKTLKVKDSFAGKTFQIEWVSSDWFGRVQGNKNSNIVSFGKLHPFWMKHKENRMIVKFSAISQLVLHAITTDEHNQPIFSCMTASPSQSLQAFNTIDKMASFIARQE